MSMKRSKQRNSGGSSRNPGTEHDAWAKPPEPEPKWEEVESRADEQFVPFAMSSRYAKGDLIVHPKFGKGLVLGAEPTRIEVLFREGKKKLGHAVA